MDIVEELSRNRESGANRLVCEYKAGLMALARRFYRNESDAEEAVNATFAKVVENIDGFMEQSSLFTWMCRILANEFRESVRRKSNKMEVYPGVAPDVEDADAQEAIYTNLDASLLRDAIETLPEEIKKTVLLHYFMDMPVKEVARVLSSPTSTITWRLHYARRILAAKLGVAADKAKDAVKKPGVKATLLVLALCALTAAGAAVTAAVRSGAQDKGGRDSERADAILGSGGVVPRAAAIGETGETSGSGGVSTVASTPTPVPPDSPVPPVITSSSPSTSSIFSTSLGEPTMNTTTLRSIAASAAFAAATANGGLLYEPSNYAAQENLVLHLDGIRNAGALKAHDASATSWADLASSRAAAIREISSIPSRSVPSTSLAIGSSGWMDDGYYFNGTALAQMSSALTLGNTYTIQVVCDVDTGVFQSRYTQSQSVSGPPANDRNLQWPGFVGTTDTDGTDYCNIYYNCGSGQQNIQAKVTSNFNVPVAGATWDNHYLTAWSSGSQVSLFSGAAVGTKTSNNLSIGTRTLTFGTSYGGSTYGAWRRSLVGTIKAIRIYDTALTDAQLAQNRALDEIRFFGNGIPVTNVVVATAVEGLEGNEASGVYALDASGHTFSAPASAPFGGKVYNCTGYSLETWSGSAWGAPVPYESCSYSATDTSALVRLIWQWEEAEFVPTDYAWMASPADANWNASSLDWNSGEAWADGNNAVFGSSSQTTITVDSERLVNDLTIDNVAYTFNGAGLLRVKGTITPVGAKNQNFNIPLASGRDDGSLHFYATGVDWRSAYLNNAGNQQTSTVLDGTVFLMPNSDGAFGVVPASPAENIVIESGNPTIYGNAAFSIHSNRTVKIKSGAALWTGSNSAFTYKPMIVAEPDEGSDWSLDTYVKIRSNWGGLITFDPGANRTNAFGRLVVDTRRLKLASGVTAVTGPATSTGESAITYVKGNGSAFATDRGYLLIEGGELFSPKMTGDRYVDVSAYGQVVVTNGGKVVMPEGVQWINGYSSPGKLTVTKGGTLAVEQLRVSQSGADQSEVHLDDGGRIAVYQLRMDNASTGLFAFNGGYLQALRETRAFYAGASASWANVSFTVGEKGAGFDLSNGVNLWWSKMLQSGAATDGGLFKKGSGILVLTSTNAYNGPTILESGRIQARVDHAIPDATTLRLGGGTGTRFIATTYETENPQRDTVQAIGRVEGSGELDFMTASSVTGAIAPDPDGAIEFQTTCSLSGDYEVTIDASGCSCLKVATGQDISGLAVKVVNPDLLDANATRDKYKILEGGYAGQFKLSQDFPKEKWGVRYDTDAAYLSPVKAFVIMLK